LPLAKLAWTIESPDAEKFSFDAVTFVISAGSRVGKLGTSLPWKLPWQGLWDREKQA